QKVLIACVEVHELRIREIRVADEQAIAVRIEILLRRQFSELRPADRLRGGEAQLHIVEEVPGHGPGREEVFRLDFRRLRGLRLAEEQRARPYGLQATFHAPTQGDADE